jgi:hypothetical protein
MLDDEEYQMEIHDNITRSGDLSDDGTRSSFPARVPPILRKRQNYLIRKYTPAGNILIVNHIASEQSRRH